MSSTTRQDNLHRSSSSLPLNTHSLAIFSICVYIVCSVVFEFSEISLTALSSYSLYLCLGCCLLDCIRSASIRLHWVLAILLVFGLMIWVSTFYTPASAIYTESRMYRYWTSLILAFLVLNVKPDARDIKKIINAFIIAGVAQAMYIYLYYGFDALLNSGSRLQNGDFGNVNVVGMNCAFSAMLAVYAMVVLKKKKLYCIAAFVICLPCIMFSGSRKALLTLVICLVALVFLYSKNVSLLKKVLLGALILAGIIVVVNVVPAFAPIKERLMGLFDVFGGEKSTVVGDEKRMKYLTGGWQAFLEKPLIGYGFCYSYHIFGTYSHNNYVELLMCHGIVGFIIYYYLFFRMIRNCYRSEADHRLKVFVYVIVLQMLLEDIGTVTYYNRETFLTLAILNCCIQTQKGHSTLGIEVVSKAPIEREEEKLQ